MVGLIFACRQVLVEEGGPNVGLIIWILVEVVIGGKLTRKIISPSRLNVIWVGLFFKQFSGLNQDSA